MLNVFLSFFNCIVVSKFSSVHQITIEYKSIKRGVSSMNQIFLSALWNDILLLTSLSRQTIYFFKFYKWQIGECAGLIIFFCPVMILYLFYFLILTAKSPFRTLIKKMVVA